MADVLLSTEPLRRRAVRHWALMAHCYAVATVLLAVAVRKGIAAPDQVRVLVCYYTVCMLGFYVALRAGWTARLRDPLLTFPMALFTVSAIVLAYGLTELSRAVSLQLLFLLVVFDILRLTQRQINVLTVGAMAMLLTVLAYLTHHAAHGFNLRREIFNMAMACVMLPALSIVAREVRRLRRKQIEQRSELEKTIARLRELSIRDPLTGLFNRRHLLWRLKSEAQRSLSGGHPFCIAILDLDWFKRINDTFGHLAGDAVLRDFAQILFDELRTSDVAGRWGGEEFVIVYHDTDVSAALQALGRLRAAVTCRRWSAEVGDLRVTFSAGVCLHRPGDDLDRTLEHADRALYQAKARGRNRSEASTGCGESAAKAITGGMGHRAGDLAAGTPAAAS